MNVDERFILIRNHGLFKQLTAQECGELNIVTGFMNAGKNDFIYLNSLKNDRLYFLKKGYVKIGHYDKDGNEVIKEILNEGDIFGQIALHEESSGEEEFAQVMKKDAIICSFTVSDFEKILIKRPDLAISFTKLVGLRLKKLQTRLSNIIYKDVRERLLEFLLYLLYKNNTHPAQEHVMENYLTHADIASLIGSTRQTVTTLINQLEQEKLISFTRKQVIFCDTNKLAALIKRNRGF